MVKCRQRHVKKYKTSIGEHDGNDGHRGDMAGIIGEHGGNNGHRGDMAGMIG